MVTSAHDVVKYTKKQIRYNILITATLQNPTTVCTQRCQINQLLLYFSIYYRFM